VSQAPAKSPRRHCNEVHAGGAAVVLALTALFYVAAVQPAISHWHAAATQGLRASASEQQVAMLQAEMQAAQTQLISLRIPDTGPTLQPMDALNRRLSEIASLAAEHRLNLAAVHPGAAVAARRCIVVPISLAGTGTFVQCVAFLHDLHDRLADVSTTAFDLTAVADAGHPAPMAKFQLELRWYAAGAMPAPNATASSAGQ
jgi:hypothetical protein